MSLRSLLRKVVWAPGPEANPDVSEIEVLLAALDLRLKDVERISWRNDKRIARAFGPIPIDGEVDKQIDSPSKERVEQPAVITPLEGEPTLTPEQFQQILRG